MLAISHSSVLPSARWNSVGALISDLFHGSIALPACPPYLYDSCIRNFTPVYPGALQLPSKTTRFFVEFR
jgi:hypothetical protein